MGGCTNEGPFNGGIYNDVIINRPAITGGTITGTELSNISLTQNITISDTVAQQLAAALCDYIKDCVEFPAEDVAAVFIDCGGKAHVPGAQLPTCAEMDAAITAATAVVVAVDTPTALTGEELPTDIIGANRSAILGMPIAWWELGNYRIPLYAKP